MIYSRDSDDLDAPPLPDDYIAPAPRVSVQAFCENTATADAVQSAGLDRRLAKAHLTIKMGGVVAAIETYHSIPTPNVIILETKTDEDILAGLDDLATVCDAGTRVVVIGSDDDVAPYRDLVRRGVSDYVVGPVVTLDVVRAICGFFSAFGGVAAGGAHQGGMAARPRPGAGFGGDRSRPCVRHRQPRLQQGSVAGHRQRGVCQRTARQRVHRASDVEMPRPSEPAGRAGGAPPRL